MTTFGPQLIGETEKTLNAILRRVLAGADLTELQWVTLRLAGQNETAPLADLVRDRAHFEEADAIVAGLGDRGLVAGQRLSAAGRDLVASVQDRLGTTVIAVFADLPAEDVAATERILTAVLARAREQVSAQVGE